MLDGIFVYLAVTTHTGVVYDESYDRGLDYNKLIDLKEKQESLNWNVTMELVPTEKGKKLKVGIEVNDKFLKNAKVSAKVVRPTQEGYDFNVYLIEENQGYYSKGIYFPLEGMWEIKAFIDKDGVKYQKQQRFIID